MKQSTREFFKITVLILLWFGSVYFALEVWFPTNIAFLCGLINAALGVAAFVFVISREQGAKLFFSGPNEEGEGWIVIGLLWAIPGVTIIIGVIWWGLRYIIQMFGL